MILNPDINCIQVQFNLNYANSFVSLVNKDIKMNTLGRTGVKVSKNRYGCGPLGWDTVTQDEVNQPIL